MLTLSLRLTIHLIPLRPIFNLLFFWGKLGAKVFKALGDTPFAFKFINMLMACTGGGILVPIFINSIPVPLSTDAYPIAILTSFTLHTFFPVLREVLFLSPVFKVR